MICILIEQKTELYKKMNNAHALLERFSGRKPLINIILDGFGIGKADESNAIFLASTPFIDHLREKYAHTSLLTHGKHVGLPGEKVEIQEERIFINGRAIKELYALHTGMYTWGPERLGEDEYFVLGDNRNSSSDSHSWGALSRDAIIGKAWISYWPPERLGLVPHYSYAYAATE